MRISAVVLTKNEEKNIRDCLKTLSWCDEIVVVDDNSSDRTVDLAKKMGAKVFLHPLNNNFSQQRNFGLKKAKGDLVFFVDSDERVSEALAAEIKNKKIKMKKENIFGFYLKRRDFIFGRWLKFGETARVRLLRLARRKAGRWEGAVHEVLKIKGKTKELKNPLLHYPHPTTSQFLEKIDQYSTIRARELYGRRKKTNFFEIITYPVGKFLKNYFWNLGFLDGLPGFLHAVFMSFHSFLVRGKLWSIYATGTGRK